MAATVVHTFFFVSPLFKTLWLKQKAPEALLEGKPLQGPCDWVDPDRENPLTYTIPGIVSQGRDKVIYQKRGA
jgi:hypothetical protein